MAKGKVKIEVEARTDKATAAIKKLKKEAESGNGLKGFGDSLKNLDNFVPGVSKLEGALGGVQKAMSLLSSPATGAAAGVGLAFKVVNERLEKLVQLGEPAARELNKMTTSLELLDRNMGGTGAGIGEFARELQSMSANGVNSMEDLSSAAGLLQVAFGGNTSKSRELLTMFDDLAAATGMQVADWASMASEVKLSGVSIKDLTRLSNRGIPIYQAFADVLGTTAEEAEGLAKAGQISTEEWIAAVTRLHERYKGLSSALSGQTMEGAQATFDASKSMKYQGAAAGYETERIKYLNEASAEMQKFAENPAWNETMEVLGGLKGKLDNFVDTLGKLITDDLPTVVGTSLQKLTDDLGITDYRGAVETGMQAKQAQRVADVMSGFGKAIAGELSLDKMEDIYKQMTEGRLQYTKAGLTEEQWQGFVNKMYDALVEARKNAAEQGKEDEAAAKAERARQATAKYGTLEERVAAVSGRDYVQQILSPEELGSAIAALKKGLMEGVYEDVKTAENSLKTLEGLQKEYLTGVEAAKRAEDELTRSREKAAEVAAQMELDESKLYVSEKGKALKELSDAQEAYNKSSDALQKFYADQRMRNEEEAQGIYRDKWKGMDVASVTSKEAELVEAQKKAADRVADTNQKLADFDKNWQQARDNINRFMSACVSGAVVKVKGTALAG